MKKTLSLCITIFLCFFLSKTKAQTDTSKYDLGRVQIKKNLSQAITIKGADLEKMPFTNLSDAINVWLYGVYGGQTIYTPVIDGVVMTDVNALSIYDIDEITLVQNAATTFNGATSQHLLLLIKTRRSRQGKFGIEAAGQTNGVKLRTNSADTKSSARFYNQYYLSGYLNTAKVNAGLSADYQRDAMPMTQSLSASGGYTNENKRVINRYKFNGYLDANLGKSILNISAGYVPQSGDEAGTEHTVTSSATANSSLVTKLKDNLYYSNISLKSSLGGFQNTLTGGYEHFKNTVNQTVLTDVDASFGPYSVSATEENAGTSNNYVIKDNLSYQLKSGGWEIEPDLNFMYRYYKNTGAVAANYQAFTPSGIPFADSTANYSNNGSVNKGATLTPALNINYGKALTLQAGFETVVSTQSGEINGNKPQRIYPFAAVMLNLTALNGKENSNTGLSLFGSFAKSGSETTDSFNLLTDINTNYFVYPSTNPDSTKNIVIGNPYQTFNQWQIGITLSLFKNKLVFNYTYNTRQYNTINVFGSYDSYSQFYFNYYVAMNSSIKTHRFGVDMNWVKSDKLSWRTNFNTSYIKTTLNYSNISQNNHVVTGGLINRIDSRKVFFGADVLYLYNRPTSNDHYNAFNLQNLYAGVRLNVNGVKNLEVFANMRSMIQSKSPTLLDDRKYYGLGFKLGL